MAELIAADGSRRDVAPADRVRGFTLEELYALLNCQTVEAIALAEGDWLIMDEDAKGRTPRLAENPVATKLLHQAGGIPWDVVLGPVMVCSRKEFQ